MSAEASRLQQQADVERRVEIFAQRQEKEQRSAQLQPPQPMAHHSTEELSGSEDDWEVEEVDDGMVAYAWKSKDELLQQWDEQQHKELPLPPIPEPSCADEASLLLAQFRPIRRTPEDLKRLLEARADPNIVIPTETFGTLCPLEKILDARHAHVPIFF